MKRIHSILALVLIIATPAHSWGQGIESYLGIGAHGAVGGLMFNGSLFGPTKSGASYGGGLTYTCYINGPFGFTTGVHLDMISSGFYVDNASSTYRGSILINDENSNRHADALFNLSTSSINETYHTLFLEIPIQLAIQYRKWYWNAGLKVAVPLSMTVDYKYGATQSQITRIYGTGTNLSEPMDMGTYDGINGSYNIYDEQQDLMRMFLVMMSLEMGYHVACYGNGSSLSLSCLFDFAVNQAVANKPVTSTIVTIDGDKVHYNGTINSGVLKKYGCTKFGLKLQFNLGIGKAAKANTKGKKIL